MTIQPTLDRVVIRPDPEHIASKILIPEVHQKIANRGTVLAVGPGRRHIDGKLYPSQLKPGDKVLFAQLRAFKFENDGEKLVMVEGEDVVCVLNETNGD